MITLFSITMAAPPSSVLQGPRGQLSWQVQTHAQGVRIQGSSPKWKVTHTAGADLTPQRTEHQDAEVTSVVVFDAKGATVTRGSTVTRLDQVGLWDGDTVDVRLGSEVARGRTELSFSVVDPTSAKIYALDSTEVGRETCGAVPCTHVKVQLTGMLRYVGPTWHYWYGGDGKLLRFDGPIGTFEGSP